MCAGCGNMANCWWTEKDTLFAIYFIWNLVINRKSKIKQHILLLYKFISSLLLFGCCWLMDDSYVEAKNSIEVKDSSRKD